MWKYAKVKNYLIKILRLVLTAGVQNSSYTLKVKDLATHNTGTPFAKTETV